MENSYNVVFVGQTGVGKSSLINYLYGEKIAEVGTGKPVTQKGFKSYNFHIKELPVKLFDSWGLEVGKETEWQEELAKELENRSVDNPPEDWFHTVFYCIDAASERIQNYDISIIKQFLDKKYKVVVVLTKSDLVSEDNEKQLKNVLVNEINSSLSVIPVCSEQKKTRSGISETFGKEKIEDEAYKNFWISIKLRLPERCKKVVINKIDEWGGKQLNKINNLVKDNTSPFLILLPNILSKIYDKKNLDKIYKTLQNDTEEFAAELQKNISIIIEDEIKKTIEIYFSFSDLLNYPPPSLKDSEKIKIHSKFSSYMTPDYEDLFSSIFDSNFFTDIKWWAEMVWYSIKDIVEYSNMSPKSRQSEIENDFKNVIKSIKESVEKQIEPIVKKALDEIL
jgi:GTP-binding protein EngB required for normal cell division